MESVSVAVRPAVNTITLQNYIRLSSNFVHRILSSISRSNSKMRRIRQGMTELSKKLSFIPEGGYSDFLKKKNFSQNYLKHI
jgi:hypothetical protein